jgi:hypothetical protein
MRGAWGGYGNDHIGVFLPVTLSVVLDAPTKMVGHVSGGLAGELKRYSQGGKGRFGLCVFADSIAAAIGFSPGMRIACVRSLVADRSSVAAIPRGRNDARGVRRSGGMALHGLQFHGKPPPREL